MVTFEEHSFSYNADGEKTTFYLAAGPADGPLLIFIHGWPGIAKTWKYQLEAFAWQGFRTIAPDMPGYGKSTANKKFEDYSMETVNNGMLALLQHLGRDKAIWIGHDWGCGAVWSFVAHYPEKTIAAAGLAVPYGILERGLDALVKSVNRDIYPEDKYPYGQFDYQRYYETDFDAATAWFDADPGSAIRRFYSKGQQRPAPEPARTSNVRRDRGWFGKPVSPDPSWKTWPLDTTVFEDEAQFQEVVQAMKKTGYWTAGAWYMNHERNNAYFVDKAKNDGYLDMPVLFIEAQYDYVCDIEESTMAAPQRKHCKNLTEARVSAGHWLNLEKPTEVNAIITKWLVESVKEHWPATWTRSPA